MYQQCFINERMGSSTKCSKAFAGITHALSALAVFFVFFAFFQDFLSASLGSNNLWAVAAAGFVVAGAALIPDLDNTRSLAHSTLSVSGEALSKVMKAVSIFAQRATYTKYDKKDDNPHRKLWHTPLAWVVVSAGMFALFGVSKQVSLPVIGEKSLGWLFALLVFSSCVQLALMGLFYKVVKKTTSKLGGELILDAATLVVSFLVMTQIPSDDGLQWLAVAFLLGTLIHLAGDMFTTMGIPAAWPFKVRGKRWYFVRFLPLKSGGDFEKTFVRPAFVVIVLVCIAKIILSL